MRRAMRLLTAFALLLAANPALADSHFERGGNIEWTYSSLRAKSGSGESRASGLSQLYELWGKGPMVTPAVGRLSSAVNFSDGLAVSQGVNANSPKIRALGYRADAAFLHPGVRKYVQLDARTARANSEIAESTPEGSGARRTVDTRSWGLQTGLSVPNLPSLSVSRDFSSYRDAAANNPLRQDTGSARESMMYQRGALGLDFGRDRIESFDRVNSAGNRTNETRKGAMTLNFSDIKATGPGSFYMRTNYTDMATNGSMSTQDILTTTNLRSDRLRIGSWKSYLGHNLTFNRNALAGTSVLDNMVSINSEKRAGTAVWTHALQASRQISAAPTQSVSQDLGATTRSRSGRVSSGFSLRGGYSEALAGAFLDDSARGHLAYAPRLNTSARLEFSTEGSVAQGPVPGGRRANAATLGLGFPLLNVLTMDSRLGRSRSRNFETGSVTVTDSATLGAQAAPASGLTVATNYNVSFSKTNSSPQTISRNLSVMAAYAHSSGVTANWQMLRSDASFSAKFEGGYAIGKAVMGLGYEAKNFSGGSAFSVMSVFFKRRL